MADDTRWPQGHLVFDADEAEALQHEVTQLRREVKVPLPGMLYPDLVAWVDLHPAHWRRTYPSRRVNNIYFDSPDYAALNANLAGISGRAKLRLRWYGPMLSPVPGGRLELKQKRGRAGWKESVAADLRLDLGTGTWDLLFPALRAAVCEDGRRWLDRYSEPVLVNSYRRDYFATPDEAVRLTVDRDLRAYGQRSALAPNLTRSARTDDVVILELKAPETPDAQRRLDDVLAGLPVAVGRFSKYVSGVLATPDFA